MNEKVGPELEREKPVIIPNLEKFQEVVEKISQDGPDTFHVISDFDGTLTKAYIDGKKVPSIISILRDGSYLTPDYAAMAHELFNTYHPFEKDPSIPPEMKKEKMHEWWSRHFELLIKSGLNREDIKRVVKSGKLELRNGVDDFIKILHERHIPLVIISSSGLGTDSIALFLEEAELLLDNVHIVSNAYQWDENGKAVGVSQPIIHGANKDETVLKNFPFYESIVRRTNALVLGDNPGDTGMLEGSHVANALKVGFLNEPGSSEIPYTEAYDAVLLNDPDMEYINDLVKGMFK